MDIPKTPVAKITFAKNRQYAYKFNRIKPPRGSLQADFRRRVAPAAPLP
jgi:hypothetical protein